ncbi:hypothetical protein CC78DRAFT_532979 [Lojkania enalia]|uniref:Uncharacterized protein n=1 Tax=Lojkania enalia TaxID=147567 RepID=A0A9P4N4K2_9PLEO|nr:hypothetical protein CC78DRAFT_532979 [Didymosphaeria enalia]
MSISMSNDKRLKSVLLSSTQTPIHPTTTYLPDPYSIHTTLTGRPNKEKKKVITRQHPLTRSATQSKKMAKSMWD